MAVKRWVPGIFGHDELGMIETDTAQGYISWIDFDAMEKDLRLGLQASKIDCGQLTDKLAASEAARKEADAHLAWAREDGKKLREAAREAWEALDHKGNGGITVGNAESIAWHLEQGHDNGMITKTALASFLRFMAADYKTALSRLSTLLDGVTNEKADSVRDALACLRRGSITDAERVAGAIAILEVK